MFFNQVLQFEGFKYIKQKRGNVVNILLQTYRDSMCKLRLMTNGELEQIFGPLDHLIPIHEGRA